MNTGTFTDSSEKNQRTFLTVGIGASAGGITPLKEFFATMPADSGIAFVVILHLSPEYESQLDVILQTVTQMSVIQVHETLEVEPNHVYVIPPNNYLIMVDGEIRLTEPQKTPGKRITIDLFFRTLADAYGKSGIAIVLSGTGSDGTLGLKRIKEAGGICIAQDPKEAEYDDMPKSAINTKLVDLVLPVSEMPQKLLQIKRGVERFDSDADIPEIEEKTDSGLDIDSLHDVLALLNKMTGHDFTDYKRPTMLRRVTRRLQVHGFETISEYQAFLHDNSEEVQMLLRDLLISVTHFFRDKEAFASLEEKVIPLLFKDKGADDQIRVWSVACATGEEAYSLAMLLTEYASKIANPPRIQIFASDIDEASLAIARAGRFEEAIELDVSPRRLQRFFIQEDSCYVVKKEIRELILFAPHNVLRDPPFSRLDLVVCRNLLIYLNRPTQEKAFELFHFALRSNGILFVGVSESAESTPALFSPIDKKQRIYQARPTVVKNFDISPFSFMRQKIKSTFPFETSKIKNANSASFADLHSRIIERFSAPSVLVDENYDILHSGENATSFLKFASGEPTRNLLQSVLPSLKQDLRAALITAREKNMPTEMCNIRIEEEGQQRFIDLCVKPIESPATAKGFFLVTFDEIKKENIPAEMLKTILEVNSDDAMAAVINRLETELHQAQAHLRITLEEQETTVEELKASNEELQAMNEELRLSTEELETGREELQSINEELTTVNYELKETVEEVTRGNSDLKNLIASTDIGTIFLDRSLHIKLFTPPVKVLFNIINSDIGRPLEHITHKLDYDNFLDDAREMLRSLHSIEREVRSENDRWYLMRITPYRTKENLIDGVVMTFVDVTEIKEGEVKLTDLTRNVAAGKENQEILQVADQRKDVFLATLAHEIRNPLAPIRNGLELIRRSKGDPETIKRTLDIIERQTNRIIHLVDDLLDIARITQGKIHLRKEPFRLKTAIDAAVESCQNEITANKNQLTVWFPDKHVYIDADLMRIEQVLHNLLTNSAKYTPPGGKIWLNASKDKKEAVITVRDNGLGLPPDRLASIFEMFNQVEKSSNNDDTGLGIGLGVVKQLVELHGGSVSAASEGEGKGSEFTVRLPLANSDNSAEARHPEETRMVEEIETLEKKVLIVDDNTDIADMIKTLLSLEGHDVRVAYDGESGIEIAKEYHPDVCLCDIGLPKMDGYELGRQLRTLLPDTKLIAFSGWGQNSDKERSREAGFDEHVVKASNIDQLIKLIA